MTNAELNLALWRQPSWRRRVSGLLLLGLPFVSRHSSFAGELSANSPKTNETRFIDLPAALRLAGAQNLDVQMARERLAEAKANHQSAVSQFFPWLSPGITYRRHDDKLQDVAGNLIDVHKYSYAPGAAVGVQLDLGEAIYQSLAAKQLAKAADHALEAQRQDSVLAAAQGYFELALAQGAVGVANEAARISLFFFALGLMSKPMRPRAKKK